MTEMINLVQRAIDGIFWKVEERKERNLISNYAAAAKYVGQLSTLTAYGLPMSLEKAVEKWRELEQKYADRGFRPIDKKILSERSYNCNSIADLVGQRLEEGENPVLYAPAYKEAIERRKNRPEGWGGVLSTMVQEGFSNSPYYFGPKK